MKNKKMLYVLIPATLMVWGLIIFKIINNSGDNGNPTVQSSVVEVAPEDMISDTFSIHPGYRDPFLGKTSNRIEVVPSKNTPPPKPPVAPAITPWPNIVYGGVIKNTKLKKEMILIQINGQDYMLKVGEVVNGVQLYKTFQDSIEVHFLKGKKIIHK